MTKVDYCLSVDTSYLAENRHPESEEMLRNDICEGRMRAAFQLHIQQWSAHI